MASFLSPGKKGPKHHPTPEDTLEYIDAYILFREIQEVRIRDSLERVQKKLKDAKELRRKKLERFQKEEEGES